MYLLSKKLESVVLFFSKFSWPGTWKEDYLDWPSKDRTGELTANVRKWFESTGL